MATRKYDIKLHLDASASSAAARQATKEMGGIGDAAQKAADRAAKSAQKLADTQAAIFMRAADRKVAIAERAADRDLAIQQRAGERAIIGQERADARIARSQKKLWDDATIQAKVAQQKIANANEQRVQAAMHAAGVEYRGFKNGWEGADKLMGGLKGVAGAFGLVTTAAAAIDNIRDSFDRANRTAMESAKFVQGYRDSLLELAALKDRLGQSTPELRENLAFRSQTLQGRDDATRFQMTALGMGESAIDKKDDATGKMIEKLISPDEFKKLMVKTGQFHAAEGGNVEPYGQLAGMMPTLMGKRTNADEAFGQVEKLYQIFKPGGADFAPAVGQYLKNASYVTSGVIGKDELAAVQSMFSKTNKEGAGVQAEQFIRATAGSLGKMKGVQVEGDSQKIAQYYKGLGVTDQMKPAAIGERIAADFAARETAEKANGRDFNALDYLTHKGFGNMEDRKSILAFTGGVNTGDWGKTFKPAMEAAPQGLASRKIEQFQAVEPVAQGRKAEIATDFGQVVAGAGANEYAMNLRKLAFGRLKVQKDSPITFDKYEDLHGDWSLSGIHQYEQVEGEVRKMLRGERIRLGLQKDMGKEGLDWDDKLAEGFEGDRNKKYFEAAQEIGAKGGSMFPGFDDLRVNGDAQLRALQSIDESLRKMVPQGGVNRPAIAAPPALGPPRGPNPGGAGRP